MQIDSETIRLSCEPFQRGPVFKSQPDCLTGNLHSINHRDFLFKLELFFFSRGHLKLITAPALLYKRGLCSVRQWQGLECEEETFLVRGGWRPRLRVLGWVFVRALKLFHSRALLHVCGCQAVCLLWETAAAGLKTQQTKGVDPLGYLQHRHNMGVTCRCSFAGLEGVGATPLPA